jgi:hypothetical protein
MQQLALLGLVNRRLEKTPVALLGALSGHPDYRNDLILQLRTAAGRIESSSPLATGISEMSSRDFWIEWQ